MHFWQRIQVFAVLWHRRHNLRLHQTRQIWSGDLEWYSTMVVVRAMSKVPGVCKSSRYSAPLPTYLFVLSRPITTYSGQGVSQTLTQQNMPLYICGVLRRPAELMSHKWSKNPWRSNRRALMRRLMWSLVLISEVYTVKHNLRVRPVGWYLAAQWPNSEAMWTMTSDSTFNKASRSFWDALVSYDQKLDAFGLSLELLRFARSISKTMRFPTRTVTEV